MNFAAFERAQVAAFAYREARHTGSFDAIKAVCYIIRNRVKAAWGDGTWLSVIDGAGMVSADAPTSEVIHPGPAEYRGGDRLLQMIVASVDDIYFGNENWEDPVRRVALGQDAPDSIKGKAKGIPALYYSFVGRQPREWFVKHIIGQPQEHAQIGQVGRMMLYR